MPFPNQIAGLGMSSPFRKITLDVDGVEVAAPSAEVYELQQMNSGKSRLLIAGPPGKVSVLRELAGRLAGPTFLLYVLHTPRGEGLAGRYQSPPLDSRQVDDFLDTFAAYLEGDARHDTWVHSAGDGRTLIWDRHDLIYFEGEPVEESMAVLDVFGFKRGVVPRLHTQRHIHYYRAEFDTDAAAVLARFNWTRSDLRPEDEQ